MATKPLHISKRAWDLAIEIEGGVGQFTEAQAEMIDEAFPAYDELLASLRAVLKMHEAYHNSIEHSAARAAIAKAEAAPSPAQGEAA